MCRQNKLDHMRKQDLEVDAFAHQNKWSETKFPAHEIIQVAKKWIVSHVVGSVTPEH